MILRRRVPKPGSLTEPDGISATPDEENCLLRTPRILRCRYHLPGCFRPERRKRCGQLQLDDDVVQNDTAAKEVLKALAPGPIIRHSGALLVYDSDLHA